MRDLKILKSVTNRNEESLGRYLNDLEHIRMVDASEEINLARRVRQGDKAAEHRLITANLRFVVSCAKKYQHLGLSIADLINEGNLGLIKAAGMFDESRGFKFISYAVWWIRQAMMNALNEHTRMVRVPMNQQLVMTSLNVEAQKLEQVLEREPTLDELAEIMDKTQAQLADVVQSNFRVAYLDDRLPGGEHESSTLLTFLPDEEGSLTDDWIRTEAIKLEISRMLAMLEKRERKILEMAYGLSGYEQMGDEDIALRMGLSKERIRQLRSATLNKLRKLEKPGYLKEYV